MGGRLTTLEQMLYDLRSECGVSTNPAVSRATRGRFITLLNRIQKRLWYDYDWEFLKIDRYIELQAGSKFYDFPTDIDMDRAVRLEMMWGGEWQKVGFGIDGKHYSQYSSGTDDNATGAERSDPVWRWKYHLAPGSADPQLEAWPVPATDYDPVTMEGALKVYGIRKLQPLVNDADVCLLDSDMIVLYAAAEILAKKKAGDAQAKLENANSIYNRLKGASTPVTPFQIGGGDPEEFCEPRSGDSRIHLRVAYAGQDT